MNDQTPAEAVDDTDLDAAIGGGTHNLTLKRGRPGAGASDAVYVQEHPSGATDSTAILKPAEFLVFKIGQKTADSQT